MVRLYEEVTIVDEARWLVVDFCHGASEGFIVCDKNMDLVEGRY